MTKPDQYPFNHPWHEKTSDTVMALLNTSESGLSEKESLKRIALYGVNQLAEPVRKNGLIRFFMQFHNILIYALIIAALVTLLLQHFIDTGIILAVVIINALIGFVQEGRAEKALDVIRRTLSPSATVLRHGERRHIASTALVPGDIVLLEAGEKVPADLRLFKAHGLAIQESILTGETASVIKHVLPVTNNAILGDRFCMAFSGTTVTYGQGIGIVVATGESTQIGQISELMSSVESLTTPLIVQMGRFAKCLTFLILLIAFILLAYGYFVLHHSFIELFMLVVALSVAVIPEGLPAVLSITLSIGVHEMTRRHMIVRRLPAIETLGAISVICTDKTGTLTKNEMMVVSVATATHLFAVEGVGYEPVGEIILNNKFIEAEQYPSLKTLVRASLLCNDALIYERKGEWFVEGDPMEGALLVLAIKAGLVPQDEKATWIRNDIIPFDASHRFMATLHHDHSRHALVFVKGSPEQLLDMCKNQQNDKGNIEPLDKMYWKNQMETLAASGQRVLGFAYRTIKPEHTILQFSDVETDLVFIGMVGLIDPPRPEAIDAIAQCYAAGIKVKMITGDHAGTAVAVGRLIGLQHPEKVLTGVELDRMDGQTLSEAVLDTSVFARTSPEHKLRLVMALQSHGMIVAMTGDGVNDAPALKRADAGIAMGKKSNEVARESAEFVLVDDNFASIVAAIREGRTVYDNIKKVVSWTLPTNAGEAMTIVFALLAGLSLPITSVQILWLNLITAVTLGLALAFEPTEADTMNRAPRHRNEPLIAGELIWHIIFVSILFIVSVFSIYFYAVKQGYSIELTRTMSLNTLVVLEIFHLFYIRNIYGTSLTWWAIKGTPVIWLVVIIITLAQFAITYIPFLQLIFDTRSVSIVDGVLIVMSGVIFFAIIEIEKQIRLRLQSK